MYSNLKYNLSLNFALYVPCNVMRKKNFKTDIVHDFHADIVHDFHAHRIM